jgi:hypothetical protein
MQIMQNSEAELRALLPANIQFAGISELGSEREEVVVIQPEAVRSVAEKLAKLRRKPRVFRVVPSEIRGAALCENNQHTLLSRLTEPGDIQWFDGTLANGIAIGQMPAEFFFTAPSWTRLGTTDVHFVCSFCAHSVIENWSEGAAEAAGS